MKKPKPENKKKERSWQKGQGGEKKGEDIRERKEREGEGRRGLNIL